MGDWMPRCNAYGEFKAVQCSPSLSAEGLESKTCFCVDVISGDEFPNTSITLAAGDVEPSDSFCPISDEARVCGLAVERHRYATHQSRPDACLERGSEPQHAWRIVQVQC